MESWHHWLDKLEANGFAVRGSLKAGATDADFAALKRETGLTLPAELEALYRLADGQAGDRSYSATAYVFPQYRFLPLELAIAEWRFWQEVAEQEGAHGMAEHAEAVTVPEPEKVACEYWIPGWLPITLDGGGNSIAVDTVPLDGGTHGQIIIMGPDEDERRVLAPGIDAYLQALAAAELEFESHDGERHWDVRGLT
ncbi:SMI1/KNR4 family protein [Amycolatopsis sp. YIM 10]|uniref:SMI1/KNR4 family protein n=1 Tax=Amycolatopsis sp. YIM 10 TaxID=2653857 RepID=UPI00128FE69D|nr:SMI1/KNR4 family protein [Amycolatopsis sp. YIM 10]QFU93395.1 SMI1 / KNR4 family protein [Amycolatopsis sp. YIM 10]